MNYYNKIELLFEVFETDKMKITAFESLLLNKEYQRIKLIVERLKTYNKLKNI